MIIGNGQLAQAFKDSQQSFEGAVIFASGVSDSACDIESEYHRERDLLLRTIEANNNLPLVYFSSTSVYDPQKRDSRYIRHKVEMELLVTEKNARNINLRLPNLVGQRGNPKTLVNFLLKVIGGGLEFQARLNDWRFLIDAEWVPHIVHAMLQNSASGVENFRLNQGIAIRDLIAIVERITGMQAVYTVLEAENRFDIPVSDRIQKLATDAGLPWGESYEEALIRKYA